ncbi:hypothetical protein JW868_00875 [Candidatus Woesearchaeota archaeon]|nr:hypothetical protein [Candidatus Woesearchaeota archaeon]
MNAVGNDTNTLEGQVRDSYQAAREFDLPDEITRFLQEQGFKQVSLNTSRKGPNVLASYSNNHISLILGVDNATQNAISFEYDGASIGVRFYGWRPQEAFRNFASSKSQNPVLIWLAQTLWKEHSGDRQPTCIVDSKEILPHEFYPAINAVLEQYARTADSAVQDNQAATGNTIRG